MSIVELSKIYREFKSENEETMAISNVTFSVDKSEIFGVLGPNGAGKTTLIKIMSTMLLPSSGTCKIMDLNVAEDAENIRPKINFVYGGEKGMYGKLTAEQYLTYFCYLYKIEHRKIGNIVKNLLKKVGLEEKRNTRIWKFSKGMVERLHIARALINNPKIIFLDEPTVGLDPDGASLLKKLILEMKNEGITIIYTTHYMPEADYLCDRVAFLKQGQVKEIGTPQELKNKVRLKLTKIEISSMVDNIPWEKIENLKNLVIIRKKTFRKFMVITAYITANSKNKNLLNTLQEKFGLSVEEKDISLEDAYSYYVGDINKNDVLTS